MIILEIIVIIMVYITCGILTLIGAVAIYGEKYFDGVVGPPKELVVTLWWFFLLLGLVLTICSYLSSLISLAVKGASWRPKKSKKEDNDTKMVKNPTLLAIETFYARCMADVDIVKAVETGKNPIRLDREYPTNPRPNKVMVKRSIIIIGKKKWERTETTRISCSEEWSVITNMKLSNGDNLVLNISDDNEKRFSELFKELMELSAKIDNAIKEDKRSKEAVDFIADIMGVD